MNEKKYKSVIVIWVVIFLVLHTLSLINVVELRPFFYTYLTKLITAFVALIVLALVMVFMGLSFKKKKAGPIVGIVLGAIYILSFNIEHIFMSIVNIVAGVCFIVSCAGMIKYINQTNETVKETKEEEQDEKAEETKQEENV